MLRFILLATFVVSFSSCKDEVSPPKADETTTETSAPTEQAEVPARSVDDALSKRCSTALSRVAMDELVASQGKPSPGEQAIMDGVRKQSQAACEAEGLTEEQAACFDSIVDLETLFLAADCPAIAAKQPSWLRVPPPELRKAALDEMKKQQDKAAGNDTGKEDADAVQLCEFLNECAIDDTCQNNMEWAKKTLSELPITSEWGKSVRQSMHDDLKAIGDGKKTVAATRLLELVAKRKIAGTECSNASNLYPE